MKTIREICVIVEVNIKLFFANRTALLVLAVLTAAFAMVSGTLVKEYDKKTSLPIGVIDEDKSALSKQVVSRVKESKGFVIHEWEKEQMQKALEEETICAYFVIKPGFEDKIKNNQPDGIVSMFYLEDYGFASILSDIFAKSMIGDVLLYQSEGLYEKYMEKNNLEKTVEYIPYLKEHTQSMEQSIFESSYYKVEEGGLEELSRTENQLLSSQICIGMVSIYGAFLAMFFVMCLRKSRGVRLRMRTGVIPLFVQMTGGAVMILLAESVVSVLTSAFLCSMLKLSVWEYGLAVFVRMLLLMICLSLVFEILSKMLRRETAYQLVCVLIIFLLGGFSIMMSIGQISIPLFSEIAKNIPNYWFIIDITDIILAGKASIRLFPVGALAGLAFIYTSITEKHQMY